MTSRWAASTSRSSSIGELAGTKLLVPGNHDRCWPGRGDRAAEWVGRYRDAGFTEVLPEVVELTIGGRSARACHFPYFGDSHDEARFESHRPVDDGRLLLHGHVHTQWRVEGHQVNVGCDMWDYRPVSEEEIVAALRGEGHVTGDSAGDQARPDWPGRSSMRRSMRSTKGAPSGPP